MATLGLDPADDPGFLECEPWGFAREIFAPHQLRIEQLADRVELLSGEWTVRRTIYLDGRKPPAGEGATPMGYSVARYEGDPTAAARRVTELAEDPAALERIELWVHSEVGAPAVKVEWPRPRDGVARP